MEFPAARQRFYHEIHKPDEQINLVRAALYLAQEEYLQLDAEEYLSALETMSAEVADRLPSEPYPLRIIKAINQYLFEDLGFRGNAEEYYDPRNSYLNQVIDRRIGLPITLSLVYLEIARRLDFPMVGVGMPGHFLIRPTIGDMQVFVDPFNQGEVMFEADCQERLQQIFNGPVAMRPEFSAAVSTRYILMRILTNLKVIYLRLKDLSRTLAAIERMLLLFPEALMEQRDRGLLYYQLGRWTEATEDLGSYLAQMPQAEDARVVQELLRRMAEG